MPTERQVTMAQFRTHINSITVNRGIQEVVVHHTWAPTAADYRGIETVRGVRLYHMNVRGWSDNGYHVMFSPDGKIFLCRPMERQGAHTAGRNAHTIGVSFIANFDQEEPTEYEGMQVGLQAIAALMDRFGLEKRDLRFHREFDPKTCPGLKLSLERTRAEVWRYTQGEEEGPVGSASHVVLLPGWENNAVPLFHEGEHYLAVRDVADMFDVELLDRRETDGKLYFRKKTQGGDDDE